MYKPGTGQSTGMTANAPLHVRCCKNLQYGVLSGSLPTFYINILPARWQCMTLFFHTAVVKKTWPDITAWNMHFLHWFTWREVKNSLRPLRLERNGRFNSSKLKAWSAKVYVGGFQKKIIKIHPEQTRYGVIQGDTPPSVGCFSLGTA